MPSPLDFLADAIERAHGTPLAPVVQAAADLLGDKDPMRLLRIGVLAAFCLPGMFHVDAWAAQINQRLMILVHEGGHGVFMFCSTWGPAGRFLMFAGGSAAQIFLPLLFMAAVYSIGRRFDAALIGLWLALNFADVSRYAADAQARALPLVLNMGPEAHDWGNMLTMSGLLWATPLIAGAIWLTGMACLAAAVAGACLTAQRD